MHALPWLNHYKKHDDGEDTLKPSCMQWDRDPHTEIGCAWYLCGPYHDVRPYHQIPTQSKH